MQVCLLLATRVYYNRFYERVYGEHIVFSTHSRVRRLDEILAAAATPTEIRKMKLSSSHVAGVLYCMGGLGLQGRAAFE